jgi:hypothetical protein
MKYQKPELALIASAITAIQGSCEKLGIFSDVGSGCPGAGPHVATTSAYEADE